MKNTKKYFSLLLAVVLCFSISACSKSQNNDSNETTTTAPQIEAPIEGIVYSNIVDDATANELSSLLISNGVSEDNVNVVLSSVKDYNDAIGSDLLTDKGSIDLSSPIPSYDEVAIDNNWFDKYDIFVGYNCRITAFELMKDFITVDDVSQSNPAALFMDEDALTYSEYNYFTDAELEKFSAIYSTIDTTSSTDVNEQYQIQKAYWDSIGVKFSNNENISLISVYIHNHFSEDENELIIGHTGVLVKADNGYVFFEKLSFQLPYQMIYFNSKDELKQYLMAAYDIDTTGECAQPFILENDMLL